MPKGNLKTEIGIEKCLFNNIFSSHKNPDLENKPRCRSEKKPRFILTEESFVALDHVNPEADCFASNMFNPEEMLIAAENPHTLTATFNGSSNGHDIPSMEQLENQFFDVDIVYLRDSNREDISIPLPYNDLPDGVLTQVDPKLINLPKQMGIGKIKCLCRR